MSKWTSRVQVWKSKTQCFRFEKPFFKYSAGSTPVTKTLPQHGRQGHSRKQPAGENKGDGPKDKAYEGRDTKDSLADL